jgi:hypothetical protein
MLVAFQPAMDTNAPGLDGHPSLIPLLRKIDEPRPRTAASEAGEQALLLESIGFLSSLMGIPVESAGPPPPARPLRAEDLDAEDFLTAVRCGSVESRGGKKKDQERVAALFTREAAEVLGTERVPPYLKSLGSAWARLCADETADDVTRDMARASAKTLAALRELGRAGGLAASILDASLHKLDVLAFLQNKGWLMGEVVRFRQSEASPEAASLLEKNMGTILTRALKVGDPSFADRAVRALPGILKSMNILVERMRRSKDPIVIEAADLLAGAPGTKRSGNVGSLVNHAFASGKLEDYMREVEARFSNGALLREIHRAIEKLGGTTEQARALASNKASVISHAIHHGQLEYGAPWRRRLQNLGVKKLARLNRLQEENRQLKRLVNGTFSPTFVIPETLGKKSGQT